MMPIRPTIVYPTMAKKPKKRYLSESKGFVEEVRFVVIKLHTREWTKEGEKEVKEPKERLVTKWKPTIDGYLSFLIDSKLVYHPLHASLSKTKRKA